jgi:hypothetical protein
MLVINVQHWSSVCSLTTLKALAAKWQPMIQRLDVSRNVMAISWPLCEMIGSSWLVPLMSVRVSNPVTVPPPPLDGCSLRMNSALSSSILAIA